MLSFYFKKIILFIFVIFSITNYCYAVADSSALANDEYKFVLNNIDGCTIEFSPPHEGLVYTDNMSLQPGEYDVSISKHLYLPISLHIPMHKDVTYSVKLKSIFTNYGGGYIDELIKSGEISLDEEFEGKTLLHQLIDNFSNEYSSFHYMGTYVGPPDGAPIEDLLTALQYFINKGFDINKPDSQGKNLLSNVIQRSPAEVVALLFRNGAIVQSEFINVGNHVAGIFPSMASPGAREKWNEKVLEFFPEELLTEMLEDLVSSPFPPDHHLVKYLLEGGAYPFTAFDIYDKTIKAKTSGRVVLIRGEGETHAYLKWATENYDKIKQWKEKQQITFKLNRGEFIEIKDYVARYPDSLQYVADVMLKTFLIGSEGLSVKELADRISQGTREEELIELIRGNETEYVTSFTAEQKQYMLDVGLSPGLIAFLEEHTQQVKNIKEERAMLAMLKQEEERMAAEARAKAANRKRQAQIAARERAEAEERKQNGELFGKMLALGAGAVIANSSPLDSTKKAEFLTNYSTDVLTNNKSMSNTQQWANGTGKQSAQTGSSGGVSNEEARNKQISSSCRQKSMNGYDDGDGQTTAHCRTAIYNKCVADGLCSLYPSKCGALRSRVTTSCNMMSKMGFDGCPACP